MDLRHDGHTRPQAAEEALILVQLNPDRNPLHHFGEISRRIVRRQERELGPAGRRDPFDMPCQPLVRKGVDADIDELDRKSVV